MKHTQDPLEILVDKTLHKCQIPVMYPDQGENIFRSKKLLPLDFFLPAQGIYIECKAYGTARIHPQTENVDNGIVLIGLPATQMFCKALLRLHGLE